MSDDLLIIPEFLRKLNEDEDKLKKEWISPVEEESRVEKPDGTTLIMKRVIKEGYWLIDGKREEKKKSPAFHVTRSRSNGKQREQWLTDIISRNPDLTRVELYNHIKENNLEPHTGFKEHKNYQAHLRSILIRLKRNGILRLENNRYLIRSRKK
tara:strand:- start:1308 stop:1769 length:462 start_codon:yes stop_codon:yes gene_type:complete